MKLQLREIRQETPSVKFIENDIMEKTKKFWKSHKDLKHHVDMLLRAKAGSPEIPEFKNNVVASQLAFKNEATEIQELFTRDKSESGQAEALEISSITVEWLEISDSALANSISPPAPFKKDNQEHPCDDKKSVHMSKASTTSSCARRLEARVRAAEQKTKFEFDQQIRQFQLTQKLREADLERQKLLDASKLDELRSKRDLAMAEAAVKAYSGGSDIGSVDDLASQLDRSKATQDWINDVKPVFDTQPSTEEKVDQDSHQASAPCQPERFAGNDPLFRPFDQATSHQHNTTFALNETLFRHLDIQNETSTKLMSSLAKQSLPKCEPDIFAGDPPIFLPWKMAFKAMIADVNASPDQEMTYLLHYTSGKPKELVNTFRRRVHPDAHVKVTNLWKAMEERFGHSAEITNALLNNLQRAANFRSDDRQGYQNFYDVCEDVGSQIPFLNGLSILNSSYYMKSLIEKIPKLIRDKWENRVTKHMMSRQSDDYPPFSSFVELMHTIALKQNHPAIVKMPGVDYESTSKLRNNTNPRNLNFYSNRAGHAKSLKTDINTSEDIAPEEDVLCPIHPESKDRHTLLTCRVFADKEPREREQIVKNANICFRCLTKKHFSTRCKSDVKCDSCGRRHPTLLHYSAATSSNNPSQSTGENVGTACMNICGSPGIKGRTCGKFSLVDIIRGDDFSIVFRTYATLDDQSSHSLGSETLFDDLSITGDRHQYTLETCHGKETCLGRRGTNLYARTLEGKTFKLPTIIESDNIPEDKSEIPTKEAIQQIPHLRHIAKFLPPYEEATGINLIIGRDAPELLKVRESINGPVGAPWAQRLDLGWTVSGDICLNRLGGSVHLSCRRTVVGTEYNLEACKYEIRCKEQIAKPLEAKTGDELNTSVICGKTSVDQKGLLNSIAKDEFFTSEHDSDVGTSPDDRHFLKIMEEGFHKNYLGNWEAPLPFRETKTNLPNNRAQAAKRFESLLRNFARNNQLKTDYLEFMSKILERGHASQVDPFQGDTKEGQTWYLPHFAVYHPKKPTQVRVVFDSSAEYHGTYLNKELLQGPDLMNGLIGRLLRFRQEEVAIMCDIEQMFHSFYVNPEHRCFLRFLWFEGNDPNATVVDYQMNVHLFGNGPSPAVATFGLRKSADDARQKYGNPAHKFIHEDFYVDDGVYSCSSSEEAIELLKSAQSMLADSNLRLHKVVSNKPEVMKAFPNQDLAKGLTDLDLDHDKLPSQRTLGVHWDLEKDVFTFWVTDKDKPYTRRGVLSVIHSLYDPLGFAAPFIIIGKKILQNLIHSGTTEGQHLDWDDPLPPNLWSEWETWHTNLKSICEVEVKRCFKPEDFGVVTNIEIHAFSDASQDAVSIVIYLHLFNDKGDTHIAFVRGTSKVKPQKHLSIPRLELCAAVLLATTVKQTQRELEYNINNVYYYTDSKIVLGYIMNESRRFYVYVANRVELIRSLTSPESWRYVRSEDNPADIGTRGCSASKLMQEKWFVGPDFLWNCSDIPFGAYTLNDGDQEIRPEVKSCATSTVTDNICLLCRYFTYFSNWRKLCKSIAYLKILLRHRKHGSSEDQSMDLNPEILHEAELVILKHVQHEVFPEEVENLKEHQNGSKRTKPSLGQRLRQLDPFIHQDGLIRVGGRLRRSSLSFPEKHLIVLPKKNHVTLLVMRHYHETVHHQGRSITHGAIRQAGFWVIGGSSLVNSLIRKCVRCNLLRRPSETPKMADLPEDRVGQTAPFTNVGMDAFGPWDITTKKTRGGCINSKRWGIIFTCLASRAIHIEVVDSMDTSAFINALRRFIAIRGPVVLLRSDHGTNFIGAHNELNAALKDIDNDKVKKFLLDHDCDWKWNPPHASHFGGVWERQIGTLRRVLDGMLLGLGKFQITHDLLVTLMAEATAIVNSRPITAIPSSTDDPQSLSPASILTMKTRPYLPPPGNFTEPDLYCRSRWRRIQYLVDQFWIRWRKEYLQNQQQRRKWNKSIPNLDVGDLVLVIEKDLVRGSWRKGRISSVELSKDGIVRTADVVVFEDDQPGSTKHSGKLKTFTRPVSQLVFLYRPVIC